LNGSRTIRTDQFRLIIHPEGQLELYDHWTDPAEDKNLAANPAHKETVKTLGAALEEGWKAALPASVGLQ
jgi:iduronate 2-sulfatase